MIVCDLSTLIPNGHYYIKTKNKDGKESYDKYYIARTITIQECVPTAVKVLYVRKIKIG